jgi:hypothetical protein
LALIVQFQYEVGMQGPRLIPSLQGERPGHPQVHYQVLAPAQAQVDELAPSPNGPHPVAFGAGLKGGGIAVSQDRLSHQIRPRHDPSDQVRSEVANNGLDLGKFGQ